MAGQTVVILISPNRVRHPTGHYNFISVATAHSTIISILYNNFHARNNLSSRCEQRVWVCMRAALRIADAKESSLPQTTTIRLICETHNLSSRRTAGLWNGEWSKYAFKPFGLRIFGWGGRWGRGNERPPRQYRYYIHCAARYVLPGEAGGTNAPRVNATLTPSSHFHQYCAPSDHTGYS